VDFRNSPNCQKKFYAKLSSHMVHSKMSKIYLFKHVILLFWRCKEIHQKHYACYWHEHNYVHMCKQLIFVWVNQKPWQSINTFFACFSLFYKRLEEKGKKWRIKGKTIAQWINLQYNSFVNIDSNYLWLCKKLELSISTSRQANEIVLT